MNLLKTVSVACLLGLAIPSLQADDDLAIFATKARREDESLGTGFKLQYHHYFGDTFGIELTHGRYGEYEQYDWYSDSEKGTDVKATNIGFAVKSDASDIVELFGKIGVSRWSMGYDDTNGYFGFGANIKTESGVLFVIEYEKINADSLDLSSLNFGIGRSF